MGDEKEKPTHLDLFSGVGGFALAAQWAGFRTIGFCEYDARCRSFLERTWGLPVHSDIRTFDGKPYRGISLLTGGPPCQPASRAGKQGGEGDDRWLWPEALRVLEEAKPDCVVFENPPGILDVGIDGILSEMGRLGYEVQPFDIPACAVDSPQLRHRIWFVGFNVSNSARIGCGESGAESDATRRTRVGENCGNLGKPDRNGFKTGQRPAQTSRYWDSTKSTVGSFMANTGCERSGQDEQGRRPDRRAVDRRDCAEQLADTTATGPQGQRRRGMDDGTSRRQEPYGSTSALCESHWANSVWVPCADGKLRRAPNDSFVLVDGLHRSLLAALGNSICPQVAFEILKAIREQIG